MAKIVFSASMHSSVGNIFSVCFMQKPQTLEQSRIFCEEMRQAGQWAQSADGMIFAWEEREGTAPDISFGMRIFNADGSEAETSGNGLCCLGQALSASRPADVRFVIHTQAGLRDVEILRRQHGGSVLVSVDMGIPETAETGSHIAENASAAAKALGHSDALFVNAGTPHLVFLVDDLSALEPEVAGPEAAAVFVKPANIEFMSWNPEAAKIEMKVWERGAGATASCGSGAVACVSALERWNLKPAGTEEIAVSMPGGSAKVLVLPEDEGRARYVAEAERLVSLPN